MSLQKQYFKFLHNNFPCFILGEHKDLEVAHLHIRHFTSNNTKHISERTFDLSGTSHKGWRAFNCVMLTKGLHREDKDSYHNIGQEAFFELHNVDIEKVAFQIIKQEGMFLESLNLH